jgi:hypothetical protein
VCLFDAELCHAFCVSIPICGSFYMPSMTAVLPLSDRKGYILRKHLLAFQNGCSIQLKFEALNVIPFFGHDVPQ